MRLFGRNKSLPGKPSEFWDWIQSPTGRKAFSDLTGPSPKESQRGAAAIRTELQRVNPDLVWGFYPKPPCLEISAGGLRALIPVVEDLVAAAPDMPDLGVVAFRQPAPIDIALKVGAYTVGIDSTLATAKERPDGKYDVVVFLPLPMGTAERTLQEVGFLLLDHGFGEYFVMTRLGAITCRPAVDAPADAKPIPELAAKLLVEPKS